MTVRPYEVDQGTVTGITDGGTKPDTVNVNTGGVDGINAIWPWASPLRIGDVVSIRKVGAIWLADACLSRKVGADLHIPRIKFLTSNPTGSADKQVNATWRLGESTDLDPVVGLVFADGTPPPVPVGGNQQAFTASGGGTWDDTNGWRAGTVRQGVYPGFPHQAYGLWFLPSGIPAALSGVTITNCQAKVTRTTGQGAGGPVDLNLYSHAYTSSPAGQPSMVSIGSVPGAPQGAPATFTVPLAVAQAIAAGSVTGLGITAGSVAAYCGYDTALTLTFSY